MSCHWLTRDCSHQPLEIARTGAGLDFCFVLFLFLFFLLTFLSSLPKLVSLSLVPVYCSPLDTFSSGCVALLIYFSSHHLSRSCWCSHHFYLDLLTLFSSCLFFPFTLFALHTLNLTSSTHFVNSFPLPASCQRSQHATHVQTLWNGTFPLSYKHPTCSFIAHWRDRIFNREGCPELSNLSAWFHLPCAQPEALWQPSFSELNFSLCLLTLLFTFCYCRGTETETTGTLLQF